MVGITQQFHRTFSYHSRLLVDFTPLLLIPLKALSQSLTVFHFAFPCKYFSVAEDSPKMLSFRSSRSQSILRTAVWVRGHCGPNIASGASF